MADIATVYVVDDDDAMRRSTGLVLAAAGLKHEEFGSAAAFLDEYRRDAPGCLILDLHMAGMNGLELLQHMRAERMDLPVIIVSGTGTVPTAVEGMKLGVEDFLEKPVPPAVLLEKVRAALARDERRRAGEAELEPIRQRFAALTARERELLGHVVNGLPNKLIARQMGISVKTVENHRASLMAKMEALNGADLVRMHMLVQPAKPE